MKKLYFIFKDISLVLISCLLSYNLCLAKVDSLSNTNTTLGGGQENVVASSNLVNIDTSSSSGFQNSLEEEAAERKTADSKINQSVGVANDTIMSYIGTADISRIGNGTIKGAIGNNSIVGIGTENNITSAINSLNSKNTTNSTNINTLSGSVTKYIDYNSSTVLFDGSSATDQTITVYSDGYISAESSNPTSVSKMLFLRIGINGKTVFEGYSEQRGYNYLCSGFFPVKKGDTVYIQGEGTSTGTGVHNMQLRHYSYY